MLHTRTQHSRYWNTTIACAKYAADPQLRSLALGICRCVLQAQRVTAKLQTCIMSLAGVRKAPAIELLILHSVTIPL